MSARKEIAIVVGSTGAMGQVITRRLSDAGLQVVAVARTAEALQALAQQVPGIRACAADIADDSAIEALRAQLDAPVRMVVQGAGVATAGGVLDAPTAAITDAVNIKVGGMLRLVRAADGHLVRGSRLVAIGGHYGFEPSAYAATAGVANAALANLVRQLSWAYGERGVTAHLVAPGTADTESLRRVATARGAQGGLRPNRCWSRCAASRPSAPSPRWSRSPGASACCSTRTPTHSPAAPCSWTRAAARVCPDTGGASAPRVFRFPVKSAQTGQHFIQPSTTTTTGDTPCHCISPAG
ncbi:SDR family oxidoreductase [Comamonas testosteroni]|uniref:SDR family oxidoreductase n=1 Tax=Comamonas testosteroni TaxID=285 RepID=UPI00076CA5C9|nr:SDR family oxidoreductase [Comamonas testosteroni]KWT70790.1 3-oxoacyl-[acyl-carrier protein] reductase [Comamonas testosteroni]